MAGGDETFGSCLGWPTDSSACSCPKRPCAVRPCSHSVALPCSYSHCLPLARRALLQPASRTLLPCPTCAALPYSPRPTALQPVHRAALPLGPRAALLCSSRAALPCPAAKRVAPCCSPRATLCCSARHALLQPAHRALLPCASRPAAARALRPTTARASRSAASPSRPTATTAAAAARATAAAGGGATGSAASAGGAEGATGSAGGAGGATGSAGGAVGAGAARGGQRRSLPLPDDPTPQQLREWVLQRARPGGGGFGFLRTAQRRKQSQQETFSPNVLSELVPQRCVTGSIEAAALGASESAAALAASESNATLGASESAAALGASESATAPDASEFATALGARASPTTGPSSAKALHTFTLDSGASRCFFCDCIALTTLAAPVPVSLADPTGGPVVARASTVLPCPPLFSGSLSSLYTLTIASAQVAEASQVAASSQVSASGQLAASCSCRVLSHQTLLWHHRLGHPSLPRLCSMHSRLLLFGLPRSLPSLPRSLAPPCLPCVEGRQCVAPHSSKFPPTTAPLQNLHMDIWGLAPVGGTNQERYFLLVFDDYTRYTTVFPLRRKTNFTLPASPQQNGIAKCRIGLIMEVARTSIIHADAPHFLWPFVVRYAAHQLNLWPRVSEPETSPTLWWMGKVGDASVFRGPAPLGVSHVDPPPLVEPLKISYDSSDRAEGGDPAADDTAATRRSPRLETPFGFPPWPSSPPPQPAAIDYGAENAGVEPGGAETEGAGFGGATTGGAGSRGFATGGAGSWDAATGGADSGGTAGAGGTGGTAGGAGGAAGAGGTSGAVGAGGARATSPRGATGSGGAGPTSPGGTAGAGGAGGATGAGGAGAGGTGGGGAVGPGGARTGGAGAVGAGGAVRAGGATGAAGSGGAGGAAGAGGVGVGGTGGTGGAGAAGPGGARTRGAGAARAGGATGAGGAGGATGAAGTGGARGTTGAGGAGAGGTGGTGGAGAAGPRGARTRGTGAAGAGGTASAGGAGAGAAGVGDAVHAGGATGAADSGGAGGTAGAGGAGAGGTGGTRGAGAAGPGGAHTRGARAARAGGIAGAGGARAGGTGGAGAAGPGGAFTRATGTGGTRGTAGARGVGARGTGGAGAVGAGGGGAASAGGAGAAGSAPRRLFFYPHPQSSLPPPDSVLRQVLSLPSSTGLTPPLLCSPTYQSPPQRLPGSSLPAPALHTEVTESLTEHRELETRASTPVRARRVARPRPPAVLGTHGMALRPSSVPQRVVLPEPPASSLPHVPDPESDLARAASPNVTRLLATVVTDLDLESTAAFSLVTELVDFAARSRLDYVASLVTVSESVCPSSVGGEPTLSSDVLEDKQFQIECLVAAFPHFASMLLCPEGDPDALDIPTSRSYAEAIAGTYVDEVPPPGANIVDGMWIFRVKRPTGSPLAFKARYIAQGFSQRQGVDFFHTFSPTPKMTTLRVLLHVAAQRDYELHSLDFSTAFLQYSLHEEIWLRRPPAFTGSFPADTQRILQRPVYGLRQVPREWHDTLRTTLAALGFAPSTADPSLFLRTDTTLPLFYVLVYVDDLVFATADTEALALVLQHFGFQFSLPQPTPLSTGHSLSTPPSDESVEPSGPYPELVGCLIGSGMGLVLGGWGSVVLTGHSDASWADDQTNQRSSQGYTFSLGSSSVSWRSTRSSSMLGSSCEAELYAGAMAAQELRWLTYLLSDLGERPRFPPVLCESCKLKH
ncbi:unnamed protein product [Closterium sp. NIES-54]